MLIFTYSWLFLLLPLPFLVHCFAPPYQETRASIRVPFFERLTEGSGKNADTGAVVLQRSRAQAILFILTWCAVVMALARPQWLEPPITQELPTRDMLLAIDLSGSMEAEDFVLDDGRKVDRLTAVKTVLDDFLTKREGDRVGMVVFGTAAFVQTPFTQDLEVCRQLLDETAVRMAGPKTAFGDAIGLAITLFERSEVEERVLIALTDGNDTGSKVPPAEAARIAADNGIVVHTVAIGDPIAVGEEQLDEETLLSVAQTTGGQYFFGADRTTLAEIYEELDRLESRKVETISFHPQRDLFHWPLGVAFLLNLLFPLLLLAQRSFSTGKRKTVTEDA